MAVTFPSRAARALLAAAAALSGCSGGAGHEPAPPTFPPSSQYDARCAAPRTGDDPLTGYTYPDRQGTLADEKTWVRSWIDELYLWYREVPNPPASGYATPQDYFAVLKTAALTPSGRPKDRYHFVYRTADWEALALSGVEAGYGVLWVAVAGYPPRQVVAAYTDAGGAAESAGIARGAQVLAVDGVDLVYGTDVATLNAGLSPASVGETHTFVVLDAGASTPRTVSLTSSLVASASVQAVETISTSTGTVGYFLFNDHLAPAEAALASAVSQLVASGVSDLVIDLRYNGGGLLDVASEAAYMVAGPAQTSGEAFEIAQLNDRFPTRDPVTGEPFLWTPFHSTSLGFSLSGGQPLPSLGLSRVFVLTGPGTCSASEALMNGLSGIDVQVIQIGSTTCGKPYGFYPADNCGTTYFAIQTKGVNAKGFGDYADGFTPGTAFAGCSVGDDFTHALGDPAEARLAAALRYRETGSCAAPAAVARMSVPLSRADGVPVRAPGREIRVLSW